MKVTYDIPDDLYKKFQAIVHENKIPDSLDAKLLYQYSVQNAKAFQKVIKTFDL